MDNILEDMMKQLDVAHVKSHPEQAQMKETVRKYREEQVVSEQKAKEKRHKTVSYTHLTLPTTD